MLGENKNIEQKCVRCNINASTSKEKKPNYVFMYEKNMNVKKAPPKLMEMQQAFNENLSGAPVKTQNNDNKQAPPPKNDNQMNTLSQIAPFFNLLSGGKNPEIGSLMSALGSRNMDMNKMINAVVQNQSHIQKSKPEQSSQKEKVSTSATESQIKNLKRI